MKISILRLPSVIDRTGLSRSTIYLRVSKGLFPKPIQLSERAVGWIEKEINDYLEGQVEFSRNYGEGSSDEAL